MTHHLGCACWAQQRYSHAFAPFQSQLLNDFLGLAWQHGRPHGHPQSQPREGNGKPHTIWLAPKQLNVCKLEAICFSTKNTNVVPTRNDISKLKSWQAGLRIQPRVTMPAQNQCQSSNGFNLLVQGAEFSTKCQWMFIENLCGFALAIPRVGFIVHECVMGWGEGG